MDFYSPTYLPKVEDCTDYAHYCVTRQDASLQCIPEILFNSQRKV